MRQRKNRIVQLISVLLVAGFLATSLASYYVSRHALRAEIADETLPLTSDNIYSEIQRDLLRPIFISSLMASDTFLRDWVTNGERNPERMIRYLKEIQSRYHTFTSFFVSEKSRTYYQAGGILKKVHAGQPRDRWYFRVRNMRADHEINVDPDMAHHDAMTIFINYKVFGYDGRFIGATGVGLRVSAVKRLIEHYQQQYHRAIFFVDDRGRVTLSSTAFAGKGSRLQQIAGLAPLAKRILAADSLSLSYRDDGRTIHLNSRYIPEFKWHLLVEQPEEATLAPIHHALMVNLAICAVLTLLILFLTQRTLSGYRRRIEELAATDKLTGAYNRKAFDTLFGQARAEALRSGAPLSMLLLDLDHFKQINDGYGHPAGDLVLQEVSRRIRSGIREADMFFRWGGEEFLIVLKGCALEHAGNLAEALRGLIEAASLPYDGRELAVTASFGVAEFQAGEDEVGLIKRMDKALYAAKERGRNRVELAPAADVPPAETEAEVLSA